MIIVSEGHINDRCRLSIGFWKSLITRAAVKNRAFPDRRLGWGLGPGVRQPLTNQ
jgi:hypothetical protein